MTLPYRPGQFVWCRFPQNERPGSEAVIRKDGDRLIVSPAPKRSLLAALRQLGPLPEKDRMPPIEDFPPEAIEPVDL